MHWLISFGVAITSVFLLDAQTREQSENRSCVAAAARAVGIRTSDHVKSVRMTGTVISGVNRVTGKPVPGSRSLEIAILLPDSYLRIERDEVSERVYGFRQALLLNRWTPTAPGTQITANFPPERIHVEKVHLARLVAGLFADMRSALTLRPEIVSRTAVNLMGPNGSIGILECDGANSMPLRIRYPETIREVTPATNEQRRTGVLPPMAERAVEGSLVFDDRRTVDGLQLPHRIQRFAAESPIETILLEKIVVNPPLSLADFR